MELKSVILGIDLGSTSARAFLWCSRDKSQVIVENKQRNNLSSRYEKGDFSTSCHPFDDNGPVYVGDEPDPERRSISLKYAFYVLANASDELLQQYALVQPMLDLKEDPEFRDRLDQGLRQLFSTIQRHVKAICTRRKLQVDTIALSIPAQWNLDFEDTYRDIVAKVFAHEPDKVCFHTETEALAHYLFRDHIEELPLGNDGQYVVLFLDFGGHNMNGCVFSVVRGEDETVSFYRIGETFGAGGGSEHWEYNVGQLCSRRMRMVGLSPKSRQILLDEFNRKKLTAGPGQDRAVTLFCEDRNGPLSVTLEANEVNACFEDALRRPLAMAAQRIAGLSEIEGAFDRMVVVSGRTCRNKELQERLKEMCRKAELAKPVFTDTLDISDEHVKIAKGAAYAASNTVSKDDFFLRGAAFGIQQLQHVNYNSNPENMWDDTAKFLLDKEHDQLADLFATGLDQAKIVCDPFRHTGGNDEPLHFYRTYDVLHLGRLTRGHWRISLTRVGSGESTSLLLERSKKWKKSQHYRLVDSTPLSLYFDKGTNCMHVGRPGYSLTELGLAFGTGDEVDAEGSAAEDDNDAVGPLETDPERRLRGPAAATHRSPLRRSGSSARCCSQAREAGGNACGPRCGTPSGKHRGVKPSGSLRDAPIDFHQQRHHPYKRGLDTSTIVCLAK